jgi:hypothetical protein
MLLACTNLLEKQFATFRPTNIKRDVDCPNRSKIPIIPKNIKKMLFHEKMFERDNYLCSVDK